MYTFLNHKILFSSTCSPIFVLLSYTFSCQCYQVITACQGSTQILKQCFLKVTGYDNILTFFFFQKGRYERKIRDHYCCTILAVPENISNDPKICLLTSSGCNFSIFNSFTHSQLGLPDDTVCKPNLNVSIQSNVLFVIVKDCLIRSGNQNV